jgi:hypothetical protein
MSSLTPGNPGIPGDPGSTTAIPQDAPPLDDARAPILEAPVVAAIAHVVAVPLPASAARTQTLPGRVALLVLNVALLVACASLTAVNSLYPVRHSQPPGAPATRSTVTHATGTPPGSFGGFAVPGTPTPSPVKTTRTPSGPVATSTSTASARTPAATASPTVPAATVTPIPTPCFTCG